MSLFEIVACAPFRLATPRALTRFETSVVGAAIAEGYAEAGHFPAPFAEVQALVQAIMTQTACPAWRTSMFGPAPAVATYAYRCFGAWFSRLDPVSKGNAIADIVGKGLLCSNPSPWRGSCPSDRTVGGTEAQLWEGSPQKGTLVAGDEACASNRGRTAYMPMTGDEMLRIFELFGGGLPPQLAQAKSAGPAFLNRSFLIGVEARPASAATIGTLQDPLAIARALTEDVALIWAPGKGRSVRFLLDQPLDGAKMNALIAAMLPDLLPELVPGIDKLLPGLIPGPEDPIWGWLVGGLQAIPQAGFAGGRVQPGTPPTTGLDILDKPGSSLPQEPPPVEAGSGLGLGWAAVAAVAAAAVLFVTLRR